MRTLSSRLSMSWVSRSVPRSSESTSSRAARGRHGVQPFAQQLDRGQLRGKRRAELMRDVGQHGARARGGRLSSSVSSRITWTCRPSGYAGAGDHRRAHAAFLDLQSFDRLGRAASMRAWRIGQLKSQSRLPSSLQGFSTSPQKRPTASSAFTLSRRAACGFRYRIMRFLSTANTPSTTPGENGASFRLTACAGAREVDEVAAHVLHRARQRADFRRAAGRESRSRSRSGPSRTADSVSASTGPATSWPRITPASTASSDSTIAVISEPAGQAARRVVDVRRGQSRFDECDGLASRSEHREARRVHVAPPRCAEPPIDRPRGPAECSGVKSSTAAPV